MIQHLLATAMVNAILSQDGYEVSFVFVKIFHISVEIWRRSLHYATRKEKFQKFVVIACDCLGISIAQGGKF